MSCSRIIISLIVCFIGLGLNAQSDSLKSALNKLGNQPTQKADSVENPQITGVGRVNIMSDSSIVQLERKTRGFKEMKGYRIQIMLGSIENIKTERNKFLSLGLPYSAYLKQVVPEYSLQVGDFTSKLDVERHLQVIREHYPKAFVVVETIEPPRFVTKK